MSGGGEGAVLSRRHFDTYECEGRNQNEGHAHHMNSDIDGVVVVCAILG